MINYFTPRQQKPSQWNQRGYWVCFSWWTFYIPVMFLGIIGTSFKDEDTRDEKIQNKNVAERLVDLAFQAKQ